MAPPAEFFEVVTVAEHLEVVTGPATWSGGCPKKQTRKLYLGVRLGAWASEVKNWLPFTRSMLLYTLPEQQDAQEAELRAKYTTLSVALDERDEDASFEKVEALVESRLK